MINTAEFLSEDMCAALAERVKSLKPYYRARGNGTFWTLGASTYNDSVMEYMGVAWHDNAILTRHFGYLMQLLADRVQDALGIEVVYLHSHGLPGFHIFDLTSNGRAGHIHIDEPYTRCFWPCQYDTPLTITVPLELPEAGGGLNLYPDIPAEVLRLHDQGIEVDLPEPEFHEYKVGEIYWHTGLTPHQIANTGDMGENEHRITLQAHGVRLTQTNQYVLYF